MDIGVVLTFLVVYEEISIGGGVHPEAIIRVICICVIWLVWIIVGVLTVDD